jgi:hypothetical protein
LLYVAIDTRGREFFLAGRHPVAARKAAPDNDGTEERCATTESHSAFAAQFLPR